jgi:hypothetical protein
MTRQRLHLLLFLCAGISGRIAAQPYADLASFNYQSVRTEYADTFKGANKVDNYAINLMAPIKLDSQNMLIIRWFGEILNTSTIVRANDDVPFAGVTANNDVLYSHSFYASILPIGLQHETKDKKWKYLLLAMPKIAGTYGEKITSYNFQPGGYALVTRKVNENLSVKGGLFYNREFFGNFFVPIVSVDWKVNNRFRMYGTFPTFYKFEFKPTGKNVFLGLAYKSYTRSFLLADSTHSYVKMNDMSLKLFLDVYIKKRLYLFAEVGRMISYGIRDYSYHTKTEITSSVLYRKDKMPVFFNCGLAYRIRSDLDNKKN